MLKIGLVVYFEYTLWVSIMSETPKYLSHFVHHSSWQALDRTKRASHHPSAYNNPNICLVKTIKRANNSFHTVYKLRKINAISVDAHRKRTIPCPESYDFAQTDVTLCLINTVAWLTVFLFGFPSCELRMPWSSDKKHPSTSCAFLSVIRQT